MKLNRRKMIFTGIGMMASTLSLGLASKKETISLFDRPQNSSDSSWSEIQGLYNIDQKIINLENGYWGAMPIPVMEDYIKNIKYINNYNTIYARSDLNNDCELVRQQVADAVGADVSEIALTRGATEALQKLLSGYNQLQPGDVIAYSDLDYDSMQYVMNWLVDIKGVKLVKFTIPEPATKENVTDTYLNILKTPGLKLLLMTHLSHRTGLIMPVQEISTLAKLKGIDVIVDAAHSWGQIDFNVKDLNADFVGFNLHKWISAPLGVGFMYVNKDRTKDIDTDYDDKDYSLEDIRGRIHTGTRDFAALLTVPTALKLHSKITANRKQERLTYLRDLWVSGLRDNKKIQVLTPNDHTMHAGITSFRFNGMTDTKSNNDFVRKVKAEYNIQLVRRGGIAGGDALRISPALYTKDSDMIEFVNAINALS